MSANCITLVLADDHSYFRAGLRLALQDYKHLHIVSEAATGRELCLAVEKHKPAVVITDISMPQGSGLEAIRFIKQRHPTIGIVTLSMHEEAHVIKEAFQAGSHAYLLKTADVAEVEQAVQSARRGKVFVSRSTLRYMGNVVQYFCQDSPLSEREREVVQLLFEELTSKEISEHLHLSQRTVEEYRKHLLEKTGSKNTVGIIKYGLRKGVIEIVE